MTMNGKAVGIANILGGVSLVSVIGLAVAAGQYKERVDVLVINQAQQEKILVEQRVIANEQKHLVEDLGELKEALKLIVIKLERPTE